MDTSSTPACCQVTTTLPDRDTADRIASVLVNERWAACAQVGGPVQSTYRWAGRVERATEWVCCFKTTQARAPGLRSRLRQLHPYDTPEMLDLPVLDGDPDYLTWIEQAVQSPAIPPPVGPDG